MALTVSHATVQRVKDAVAEYDGVTAKVLSAELGLSQQHVMHALRLASGVYIDRWARPVSGGPGPWAAVWCVGDEEDCPRPGLSRRAIRLKMKEVHNGIRP